MPLRDTMRVPRCLRSRRFQVICYMALLSALCSGIALRRASAEVSHRALAIGRELQSVIDMASETTTVRLNGREFRVTALDSTRDLDTLMGDFAALCPSQGADLAADLARSFPRPGLTRSGLDLPVVRFGTGASEAASFCFGGTDSLQQVADRAARFVKTGKVGDIGQLRYLYAKKRPHGITGLLVTSQDELPLFEMFPSAGDAPGEDVAPVRPPGTRRHFSALARGYGLSSYVSTSAPQAALADYARALQRAGMQLETLPQPETDRPDRSVRLLRDGDDLYVVAANQLEDGTTLLSTIRFGEEGMGRSPAPTGERPYATAW